MPKLISNGELETIEKVVSRFPNGVRLDELLKTNEIKLLRRTLQRRLNLLIEQGRIIASGKGVGSRYQIFSPPITYDGFQIPISYESKSIQNRVNRPLVNRNSVNYNRSFLENYHPNVTHYISSSAREHLKTIGSHHISMKIAGTYARKIFNYLLIDLSWNSSRLEGNTYSLLETERLFELDEQSKNKDITETQMILNHKAAIEFLVDSAEEIAYNRSTILNLHALLSDNLLSNPIFCGRLRSKPVGIAGTNYIPPGIPQLIEECFQQILDTASKIQDPFEQSFFIMVHLPYLQPFEDVNKRVSRLASNISLIQNNLSPLSFVNVPEKAYIDGLLGVYELNQIDLLRDVFIWAYEQSADRYTTARQSLGEPDPFKLKYRQQLIELIGEVVRQSLNVEDSTYYIQTWVENNIPNEEQARFREIAETELLNLHAGNIARFRLKPSEFENWVKVPDWFHIRRAEKRALEIKQEWKKISFNRKESSEWVSILEKRKNIKNNVFYWSYQDIKIFFGLNQDEFNDVFLRAKNYLIAHYLLPEVNHFDLIDSRLTRHACFAIANILEENETFQNKAEFAQYYFGGWPCNANSFNNRVKKGRELMPGSILLELGEDFDGFHFITDP